MNLVTAIKLRISSAMRLREAYTEKQQQWHYQTGKIEAYNIILSLIEQE